jgi:hypothetical protein
MTTETIVIVGCLILLAATLYSSVGHGGGSGYLAAMALMGVAPEVMKPSALVLNILVATIGTIQFARAGSLSWRLLWPFVVASIPAAFIGGAIQLPGGYYRPLVGVVLLFAAARMVITASRAPTAPPRPPPWWAALGCGAVLGLLAGLTGTGGGIFLSPLMLLMNWADVRRTAGTSAAFILVNSIAGLLGAMATVRSLPSVIPWWALAAVLGGLIGSHFGSRRLSPPWLRRALAAVLLVAAGKLMLG